MTLPFKNQDTRLSSDDLFKFFCFVCFYLLSNPLVFADISQRTLMNTKHNNLGWKEMLDYAFKIRSSLKNNGSWLISFQFCEIKETVVNQKGHFSHHSCFCMLFFPYIFHFEIEFCFWNLLPNYTSRTFPQLSRMTSWNLSRYLYISSILNLYFTLEWEIFIKRLANLY